MAERIVTLLPAASEAVCALGLGNRIVGRSHECDYPAELAALPGCTRARLDAGASGAAIDGDVRARIREALSIYEVDAEALRRLQPDVIITQALCAVCACTEADLEAALGDWINGGCQLLSMNGRTLDGVFDDMARIGAALGPPPRGRPAAATLPAQVQSLAAPQAPPTAATPGPPPRAAVSGGGAGGAEAPGGGPGVGGHPSRGRGGRARGAAPGVVSGGVGAPHGARAVDP